MNNGFERPSRTVLVVDDDPDARFIFRLALEKAGDVVVTARDGAEAIRLLATTLPDVVLMDIMMPRMDGIGALHAVRSMTRGRVPVIAVTALASPDDQATVNAAGFDQVLFKPVFPMEVVDAVDRV